MKTKFIITTLFGLLILSGTSSAMPGKIKKNLKEAVRQEIIGQLPCPEFITENSEINRVKAIVKVDENGRVSVEEINSANTQLRDYVENQLQGMKVKNAESPQRFVLVVNFQVN